MGYSESYIQKLERGEKPISEEFANNLQKLVDLERAYRKACENYCEVQEAMNKNPLYDQKGVSLFDYIGFDFCFAILKERKEK